MLPDDGPMRAVAMLSAVVLTQEDVQSAHAEIARITLQAVPAADAASITTFADGRPRTSAASDDWSRDLDELQYEEHEGPCLDAARTGNVFRVRDLAAESRWPSYAPRAVAAGARSTLSVPLTAEGRLMGSLNLYSRDLDSFGAEEVSIAEVVSSYVGLATEVASAFFGHQALAAELRVAMASRATIEQAKGILMADRGCDADEAFEVLVQLSQHSNVKLRDVAAALVQQAAQREPRPG